MRPTTSPGYTGTEYCDEPFAPGPLTGTGRGLHPRRHDGQRAVACEKGYNASLGGAAGMILVNPVAAGCARPTTTSCRRSSSRDRTTTCSPSSTLTPTSTATWAQGQATVSQGDVMAAFSSRGPLGDFLKPDITAPGVQILAGHTPTPTRSSRGPGR